MSRPSLREKNSAVRKLNATILRTRLPIENRVMALAASHWIVCGNFRNPFAPGSTEHDLYAEAQKVVLEKIPVTAAATATKPTGRAIQPNARKKRPRKID